MTSTVMETNFDIKKKVSVLESYMSMNDCEGIIFFECTKRAEKLWLTTSSVSVRFTILQMQSIYDLSTTVNYHKNSGHVLIFTKDFYENENLKIVKNVIELVFKPCEGASVERAIAFYYNEGIIHVRNYIIEGMGEIGPRFSLQFDKILDGCMQGSTIFNRAVSEEVANEQ